MTSNTPTPARPALDAMAMSEGDEPTPEAILIAAWKLRFNKAFRPEEEAGALMAFLDTVGLCVVSKRSLADMRGAIEKAKTALGFYADPWSHKDEGGDKVRVPDFYSELDFEGVANAALTEIDAALARSAP